MNAEFLKILCCPETRQDLHSADPALIQSLNQQIAAGTLKNRAGQPVADHIEAGLVRSDRKFLYPIRDNIPILLIDEAIPL